MADHAALNESAFSVKNVFISRTQDPKRAPVGTDPAARQQQSAV